MHWRRLSATRVGGALSLLLFLSYGYFVQDIPLDFFAEQELFNARSLPYVLAILGTLISLCLLLFPSPPTDWSSLLQQKWLRVCGLVLLMLGFSRVLEGAGFVPATTVLLLCGYILMGERRWPYLLLASLPVTLALALLMQLLGIQLPTGSWWRF